MKEKNEFWRIVGKLALSLTIAVIITFVLTVIATIIFIATNTINVEEITSGNPSMSDPFVIISTVLMGISFMTAAWIMYAGFERKAGWVIGLKKQGLVRQTIQGMILGIVLISVTFLMMWGFGGISIEDIRLDGEVGKSLVLAFIMFIFVAVNEEIFSRGYVQGLVMNHYGLWSGIIVSSIIFALIHSFNPAVWDTPIPILNLFLAGVLLAVSRQVSGGLWVPIGIHLTWNFVQGNVFGFKVSGAEVDSILIIKTQGSSLISGGAFGAEGSIIAVLVLCLGIYVLYRRKTNNAQHSTSIDEKTFM